MGEQADAPNVEARDFFGGRIHSRRSFDVVCVLDQRNILRTRLGPRLRSILEYSRDGTADDRFVGGDLWGADRLASIQVHLFHKDCGRSSGKANLLTGECPLSTHSGHSNFEGR